MDMEPYAEVFSTWQNTPLFDYHPADMPDLDWDASFDPPEFNADPVSAVAMQDHQIVDEDSWWYSDAYTPNSKYEEWFLTSGQWVNKPRSRRHKRLFQPQVRESNAVNSTTGISNFVRERCGDDDDNDFHSTRSRNEGSEFLTPSSSDSFDSFPTDNEAEGENMYQTVDLTVPIPPAFEQWQSSEVNRNLSKSQKFECNPKPLNMNLSPVLGGRREGEVFQFNGANENTKTNNVSKSQKAQSPPKYSTNKVNERRSSEGFELSRNLDDSVVFPPSNNPFIYKRSTESIRSTFYEQAPQKNVAQPSIQLPNLKTKKCPTISSKARLPLSKGNPYHQLTFTVTENEFLENTKTIQRAAADSEEIPLVSLHESASKHTSKYYSGSYSTSSTVEVSSGKASECRKKIRKNNQKHGRTAETIDPKTGKSEARHSRTSQPNIPLNLKDQLNGPIIVEGKRIGTNSEAFNQSAGPMNTKNRIKPIYEAIASTEKISSKKSEKFAKTRTLCEASPIASSQVSNEVFHLNPTRGDLSSGPINPKCSPKSGIPLPKLPAALSNVQIPAQSVNQQSKIPCRKTAGFWSKILPKQTSNKCALPKPTPHSCITAKPVNPKSPEEVKNSIPSKIAPPRVVVGRTRNSSSYTKMHAVSHIKSKSKIGPEVKLMVKKP